eukprot:RCo026680
MKIQTVSIKRRRNGERCASVTIARPNHEERRSSGSQRRFDCVSTWVGVRYSPGGSGVSVGYEKPRLPQERGCWKRWRMQSCRRANQKYRRSQSALRGELFFVQMKCNSAPGSRRGTESSAKGYRGSHSMALGGGLCGKHVFVRVQAAAAIVFREVVLGVVPVAISDVHHQPLVHRGDQWPIDVQGAVVELRLDVQALLSEDLVDRLVLLVLGVGNPPHHHFLRKKVEKRVLQQGLQNLGQVGSPTFGSRIAGSDLGETLDDGKEPLMLVINHTDLDSIRFLPSKAQPAGRRGEHSPRCPSGIQD